MDKGFLAEEEKMIKEVDFGEFDVEGLSSFLVVLGFIFIYTIL